MERKTGITRTSLLHDRFNKFSDCHGGSVVAARRDSEAKQDTTKENQHQLFKYKFTPSIKVEQDMNITKTNVLRPT